MFYIPTRKVILHELLYITVFGNAKIVISFVIISIIHKMCSSQLATYSLLSSNLLIRKTFPAILLSLIFFRVRFRSVHYSIVIILCIRLDILFICIKIGVLFILEYHLTCTIVWSFRYKLGLYSRLLYSVI